MTASSAAATAATTEVAKPATSERFTAAVTLTPVESDGGLAFTAVAQDCPWPKAYGGDLVAQAVVAASRSVSDGKVLHSAHSYFLRPVEIGAPVRHDVEVLRDGRGYSARQVRATQDGRLVFTCLASFAAGEDGGSHAAALPDVVRPEALPSSADYLDGRSGGTMTAASREYWSHGRSFDQRHVPGPVYLTVDGGQVAAQAVWVRAFDALRPVAGVDTTHRDLAALAYVCDYTILEPVLRALGLAWADEGLVTASLDHAMWFHRTPRDGDLDGWLLYAQEAVAAERGRGVAVGRFFTADGTHLATVVQEGMIRSRG